MRYILAVVMLAMCACQQGSAPKLQADLAAAQAGAAATGQHIQGIKGHLDTADYKGSRAQKLLDQGVDQ